MKKVFRGEAVQRGDRWVTRGTPLETSPESVLRQSGSNILLLVGVSAELCSSKFTLENENTNSIAFVIYQIGKVIFQMIIHRVWKDT